MKKGEWVYILRQIRFPTEKKVIYRKIREVYKDSILCDDNIEYKIEQIICENPIL